MRKLEQARSVHPGLRTKSAPSRASGSQIAEFALILPILFALLYGIFWFGRAFETYETLTRAAREAARMATAPTCATCGNAFYDKNSLRTAAIDPILRAASLNPGDLSDANFQITRNVAMNPSTNPLSTDNPMGDVGTVVSLAYPMKFPLYGVGCCPIHLKQIDLGITITTQVQMREEH